MEIQGEIIELTPERARAFLGYAGPNRTLSKTIVERYAAAISRGEWVLSNDALALDPDGLLINGQHRCAAVIQAERSIMVLLVRGVRDSDQEVIDTGRARKLHDVLTIRGEKSATALAAACGWLWRFENGLMREHGSTGTHRQLLAVLDENPGLRESVADAVALARSLRIGPGLWGMLLYVFESIDPEDAEGFISRLATGADLHEDDPVLRLRTFLISELSLYRKTPPWRVAALTIKAWNAYRDGERIRQLRYRAGGASPEAFPIPH